MKLSFSLLKGSSQVLLGQKYFQKFFFIIFHPKKGRILLLQHVAFKNGNNLKKYQVNDK